MKRLAMLDWLVVKHAVAMALIGLFIGLMAQKADATEYWWVDARNPYNWVFVGRVDDGHVLDTVWSYEMATITRLYKQAVERLKYGH